MKPKMQDENLALKLIKLINIIYYIYDDNHEKIYNQ